MFTVYLCQISKISQMRNNLCLVLIGLVLLLVSSCKTEVTDREDFKNVMKVHDEAMARMGEIHEIKKQVQSWSQSSTDSSMLIEARNIISLLDSADEGMMSWMADFRTPESGSETDLMAYFESEQIKVNKVGKDINESILRAQEFINKNKK